MRFMVMVHGDASSEAGEMPDEQLLRDMLAFNDELVNAGVMLAGEGLQPTSKGARVRFARGRTTVIDGPFTESKELIAGYWIWQCGSLAEAVEWARRCPKPTKGESILEIRPVYGLDDFGEALTPELRAQEERQMERAAELGRASSEKERRP